MTGMDLAITLIPTMTTMALLTVWTLSLDSSEATDTDNDGVGNNTDSDDDNDGVSDGFDAFP